MALEINVTDEGRVEFYGLFEDLQMGPLLLWILEEEQQGALTITTEGMQQVIYFAQGYPVGTRGGPAENFLGWVLREKGIIDDATFMESLQRMAGEGQLQGQILLQMGAITQDQLQEALLLQLRRKLIPLFRPVEGEFYFLSEEDLPVYDIAAGEIDPYRLTSNAVRQAFTGERLDQCLVALEGCAIRLDPDSQWQKHLGSLGLEEDEAAALALLEPWNTLEHFMQQGYLDRTPAKMLVALLFSLNLLELDDEEEHPDLQMTLNEQRVIRAPGRQSYSPPPDEGVSIKVENAKRPGPAKDPNAPRKRASVTVHIKEDRIETQAEIPTVSTTQSRSNDGTDPAVAAVIAGPPPGQAVIAGPPPAQAVISGPPPGQAVIAGPPPAQAVIAAPPGQAAPKNSGSPRAASGGGLTAEEREQEKSIRDKINSVKNADFYAILEIPQKATPNDIRNAYYSQSRTYHPDRVAGTPLEHMKGDLDLIFSHLNEAYSTLSNPSEREEYDAKLSDPEAAALEERAPKAAQAEVFFSKANVFIRKRDFAAAEEQLQWAAKLLPDEGDFQATLAWAIYHNPQRGRDDAVKKALFHLDNALNSGSADLEKMHWYWAQILKNEGDNKGALEQVNLLLKHNPHHPDAQREQRNLRHLTGQSKAKKNEKKGLFGFLKK